MKILFVDPPRAVKIRARTTGVRIPDLALGYLSAALETHGHDTRILDADAENFCREECVAAIDAFSPDLVCMTVFTYKLKSSQSLASAIKDKSQFPKIIIGGVHPTVAAEETMGGSAAIDYCVIGEGERTLIELIERISGDVAPTDVKGVAWRDGEEVVLNESREYIEQLDSLPFPNWGAFKLDKYGSLYSKEKILELPVLGSRGCVGGCSFCYRMQGGRVRYRSIDNVIQEVTTDIETHGAKSLVFMDQVFTANQERAKTICEKLIDNRVNKKATWVCQTRADLIETDTMRMLKKAGCTHISCGIESGAEETLAKNGKKLDLAKVRESLAIAKRAGLTVDTNYILGLPYDDRRSISQTIKYAPTTAADHASFFIFVPYPGTRGHKLAMENGANLKLLSDNYEDIEIQSGGMIELADAPRKKLETYQMLGYAYFYLRPSKILNLFRKMSFGELLKTFAGMITGRW